MQRSASALGLVPDWHSWYQLLYAFEGAPDGQRPSGLVDVNGTLYGVTNDGGAFGLGTVFSITGSGQERIIYSFKGGADGAYPFPVASLVNINGTLYGTTGAGGTGVCPFNACGTVFAVTPSGEERVIYSFKNYADGDAPNGLIDGHGTLYGTTYIGGLNYGTVFAVTTSGKETVLYQFKGGSDGFNPNGGLVDLNGTLFGTTQGGGGTTGCNGSGADPSCGTVFSVSPSGEKHLVHRFQAGTDATNPTAGLIDVCGTLYGMAGGGAFGQGTVYTVSRSGKERVLYSFKGGPADGAVPGQWSLLTDVDGTLYGTTQGGGASSSGTVFKISKSGTETVLYMFKGSPDGSSPFTGVTDVHGTLYGTTYLGGQGNCANGLGCGTVYALKL
jgi:uncharacterized repeat protein (TIGR03803 family)